MARLFCYMDVQSTLDRIEALPGLLYKLGKKDAEAITELSELLFLTTGEHLLKTCGNCINKAYQTVTNFTIQKLQEMKDQKYKLKDTDSLIYFDHTHYTAATITDEVAKAMIASNKVNADLFEVAEPVKEVKKTTENKD